MKIMRSLQVQRGMFASPSGGEILASKGRISPSSLEDADIEKVVAEGERLAEQRRRDMEVTNKLLGRRPRDEEEEGKGSNKAHVGSDSPRE
jgi:hypothetical protein